MKDEIKLALVGLVAKQSGQPSRGLAIESLAAHIRHQLPEVVVHLWDMQYMPIEYIIDEIICYAPEWLGLSIPIGALRSADFLIERIRFKGLSPKIVIGNLIATNAPLELASHFLDAMIVIGEGEIPLEGILHSAVEDKDPINIGVPGLARMTKDGVYQFTPHNHQSVFGGWSEDLWDNMLTSQAQVLVEASRGCLGNCTFCSTRNMHINGWSDRSISGLIEEISRLYQRGTRWIFFVDDDFVGCSWTRALQIGKCINQEFPELNYGISIRADSLTSEQDKSNLLNMVHYGLTKILLGLESGSSLQLRRFQKRATLETNSAAIEILQSIPKLDFSIGFLIDPLMSVEELRESVHFIRERHLEPQVSHPLGLVEVHKGSQFEQLTLKAGIETSFDLNSLSWSWQFKDNKVGSIVSAVKILDQWLRPLIDQLIQIHRMQTRVPYVNNKVSEQALLLFRDIAEAKLLEFETLDYFLDNSDLKAFCIPDYTIQHALDWANGIQHRYTGIFQSLVEASQEVILALPSLDGKV